MEPTPVTRVLTRGGADVRVVHAYRLATGGQVVEVTQPLFRIGSHATNDLVLDDATVSKHHLEISITPAGYRIADLSSSNGTFVGDVRIEALTTTDLLELRLGRTTLRLDPTQHETEVAASARTRFGTLVGQSVAMRELFEQLEATAKSEAWVLIEGETGVGKERVAESLHRESPRASGPYVVIDCGALAGELVEAELFGYVRGAFTGADDNRAGLLAQAHGGTLFLDEVAELPLPLQAKLLGALGRGKLKPLGGSTARTIDVRVIAASHRNLAREVNEGRFRADLFYRLAVVRLRVPPLRERLDDIPLLVEEFHRELSGQSPAQLSSLALSQLAAQPWPGNVRELRNTIERAAARLDPPRRPATAREPFFSSRARAIGEFERRYFQQMLAPGGVSLSALARAAGLDVSYLSRILKRLGLSA